MRPATTSDVERSGRRRALVTRLAATLVVVAGLLTLSAVVVAPNAGAAGASPAWTARAALVPGDGDPGATSYLVATTCPAPGNCVAVGWYTRGGNQVGFANVQAGGSWTTAALPLPVDAGSAPGVNPANVSCGAVGSCVAAGTYTDTGGNQQAFVSTLASGRWTTAKAVLPGDANLNPQAQFQSVTCSGQTLCVLAGNYHDTTSQSQGVLLVDRSGSWSTVEAPVPSDAGPTPGASLFTVSCGGPQNCVAVGSYTDSGGHHTALVETLAGGSWTAVRAPVPADAAPGGAATLVGASCPTTTNCMLVGIYTGPGGYPVSLAVSDSAGVLTPALVPAPADAKTSGTSPSPLVELVSVSCPTVSWCAATGIYVAQGGSGASPQLATFSGGTWSAIRAPGNFDPTSDTYLLGVSCSWPGSCAAAGFTTTASVSSTGILETLTGGTWTESPAVLPSAAVLPAVSLFGGMELANNAVACVAGTCAVAGTYLDSTPVTAGFLDLSPSLTGYQLGAADGGIFNFGAPFLGSMGGTPLNAPIVGMAGVPDTGGYYEVASDGGIFAFGAPFLGSMGGQHLNKPIVGIAFDSQTGGYYEVASDGGIFAFGAPFLGSMGGQQLNAPIVGIAYDSTTGGYYEVASDGGIFAFGAPFLGSMGGKQLNKPIVGIAYDSTTSGYYQVASDGGIFAFGAPFLGSMGGKPLNKPIVGIAFDPNSGGYYQVASDGGIFNYGAPFLGSTGAIHLNQPVVAMAAA